MEKENKGVPLEMRNALVVEKKTRYEVEREHYNADGEVLRRELTLRGIVYVSRVCMGDVCIPSPGYCRRGWLQVRSTSTQCRSTHASERQHRPCVAEPRDQRAGAQGV